MVVSEDDYERGDVADAMTDVDTACVLFQGILLLEIVWPILIVAIVAVIRVGVPPKETSTCESCVLYCWYKYHLKNTQHVTPASCIVGISTT